MRSLDYCCGLLGVIDRVRKLNATCVNPLSLVLADPDYLR